MVADLSSTIHSTTRDRKREREREEGRKKRGWNEAKGEDARGKKEDSARKVWRRKKRATPRHRRFIPEATLEMCSWKSSRGAHELCTCTCAHTEERETHVRLDLCGIGGGWSLQSAAARRSKRFLLDQSGFQRFSRFRRVAFVSFAVRRPLLRRNKLPNRWMHQRIDAFTKKTRTPLFNF